MNVSDALHPPVISLSPDQPNGDNQWYKSDVTVTITTNDTAAIEIDYYFKKNECQYRNSRIPRRFKKKYVRMFWRSIRTF